MFDDPAMRNSTQAKAQWVAAYARLSLRFGAAAAPSFKTCSANGECLGTVASIWFNWMFQQPTNQTQ
ncbi:MAG: hypothetical protein ACREVI_09105 [Steroidobacteraceae bacterium]